MVRRFHYRHGCTLLDMELFTAPIVVLGAGLHLGGGPITDTGTAVSTSSTVDLSLMPAS